MKVLVYGTLRAGNGNHRLLEESEFLGQHLLEGFTMYSLGGFPAITTGGEGTPVIGEVYSIDEETFKNLDSLEGYPQLYQRQQVDTEYGKAWVYTMEQDAPFIQERNVISSGDWNYRHVD